MAAWPEQPWADGLTRDADHVYRFDGLIVPGVTQVLRFITERMYGHVPPALLEKKSQLGIAVHAATELVDDDDLDDDSIDETWAGYIEGYRRFLAAHKPRWTMSETLLYHPVYRYAGQVDRVGFIDGAEGVWDIKTTAAIHPVVNLQTAAYEELVRVSRNGCETMQRGVIWLHADGTFELVPVGELSDRPTFLGMLATHHWCGRHKG